MEGLTRYPGPSFIPGERLGESAVKSQSVRNPALYPASGPQLPQSQALTESRVGCGSAEEPEEAKATLYPDSIRPALLVEVLVTKLFAGIPMDEQVSILSYTMRISRA